MFGAPLKSSVAAPPDRPSPAANTRMAGAPGGVNQHTIIDTDAGRSSQRGVRDHSYRCKLLFRAAGQTRLPLGQTVHRLRTHVDGQSG